ncbi:unnamed protein product, partial [Prunus brigantina]
LSLSLSLRSNDDHNLHLPLGWNSQVAHPFGLHRLSVKEVLGLHGTLHKVTGEIVAIKQLKNEVSRLTSWEEFLQMAEVESLSLLKNHPNIINLKQAFMEVDGTASLVFEFMEGIYACSIIFLYFSFWKLHCSFGNYNWIFALSFAFNLTNVKSIGYPDEELENQNHKLRCRKPKPETEMKNRLRSLVVFDDGRANGLVVFDDHWW